MAATGSLNVADLLGQHLESASPDVLRAVSPDRGKRWTAADIEPLAPVFVRFAPPWAAAWR